MKSRFFIIFLLSLVLSGCGGGGGSAGNAGVGGTGGGGTVVIPAPTLTMALTTASGDLLVEPSLSQTESRELRLTLRDSAGAVVPFSRVGVVLDSNLAVLTPSSGSLLTDASGVARFTIAPASVASNGAVTATASASVAGVVANTALDMQITSGTVALTIPVVSPNTVQKGQSVNVSAAVTVNGSPAASNSLAVGFSSTCGVVSPASALVDGTGTASVVVQTNQTGACTVTASTVGATSRSAGFTVNAPPITGIEFVSVSNPIIYQQGSPSPNSSIVTFKVVNANGEPVQGQAVQASLVGQSSGIVLCGQPSSASTLIDNSRSDGTVQFSVCSGNFPDTVQVRATLVSDASIRTDSNLLAVQTGLPTQRFFDISASQLNYYVGGEFTSRFNGNTVDITAFAADRMGNPVPDGTSVVFVSEGGQLNTSGGSSCTVSDGDGRCSVKLIGQNYRPLGSTDVGGDPRPGRVTLLAYADGEESFVDSNGNNRFDAGEQFEDLGAPYLDKDENNVFSVAYNNLQTVTPDGDQSLSSVVPSGSLGSLGCLPATSNGGLSIANTCNGLWDGFTKVRRSIVVVFSGGEIGLPTVLASGSAIDADCTHQVKSDDPLTPLVNESDYDSTIPSQFHTELASCSRRGFSIRLADRNGNPMPANAALTAKVSQPTGGECAATVVGTSIGNSSEPTFHSVLLDKCSGPAVAGGAPREIVTLEVSIQGITSSIWVGVP